MPAAVTHVFRRFPTHRLDLRGSGGFRRHDVRTPLLFVGNGLFEGRPGSAPSRASLVDGTLDVRVTHGGTRRRLVWSVLRALLRRKPAEDDPERATVTELEVGARTAHLQVAYDGEIDEFATPLRYRVRPGDLHVLAP